MRILRIEREIDTAGKRKRSSDDIARENRRVKIFKERRFLKYYHERDGNTAPSHRRRIRQRRAVKGTADRILFFKVSFLAFLGSKIQAQYHSLSRIFSLFFSISC